MKILILAICLDTIYSAALMLIEKFNHLMSASERRDRWRVVLVFESWHFKMTYIMEIHKEKRFRARR